MIEVTRRAASGIVPRLTRDESLEVTHIDLCDDPTLKC